VQRLRGPVKGKILFLSADGALYWAYETVSRPIVKISSINNMRGAEGVSFGELTTCERHAQAALIIAMVERLDDKAKREYIEAAFGRRLSKDDLTVVVFLGCSALGFGLEKTGVVHKMVKGYFDGSMTHRDIRRALGCRDQYAVMVRRCLYETLDIIHDRAMADMTEVLERHGLIRMAASTAYI